MSQEAEEVITEDSEHNYEWDNYRENPSFVTQDPEHSISNLDSVEPTVTAVEKVSQLTILPSRQTGA